MLHNVRAPTEPRSAATLQSTRQHPHRIHQTVAAVPCCNLPLSSTSHLVCVQNHDTTVSLSCIIVELETGSHRNPRADDLPSAYWSVLWEHPLHPAADRPFALKQTAVTVSCYPNPRVVTGHSLTNRGRHAEGGPCDVVVESNSWVFV